MIFYPDLSRFDYNRGLRELEDATVAVIARASFGDHFVDERYTYWRDEAARVGAYFCAYHWLNDGDAEAQARFCYQAVGDTPVMVDAEDVAGNTGYTRTLTVDDITAFITALRRLGGRVGLVYLPHWYWRDRMGSPDLAAVAALGVGLVNSNYTAYSDDGPGWQPYGQVAPVGWQYTDAFRYGGSTCDFNAFQGDLDRFRALMEGTDGMALKDEIIGGTGSAGHPDDRDGNTALGDVFAHVTGSRGDLWPQSPLAQMLAGQKTLTAAVQEWSAGQVQATQDQVDAAVAKVLQDPGWVAGLAAALAAHIKVT